MSLASRSLGAALSISAFLVTSSMAAAQEPLLGPPAPQAHVAGSTAAPKVDLFAGVTVWREEGLALPGFHVSGAVRAWRHVSFVGDLGFHDADAVPFFPPRSSVTTVMGGVRVGGTVRRMSLFGQLLAGRAPLDDFALQPGVGLDVRLTRRTAIRVSGDVKVSGDDGSTYVGSRISTGVVFLLGGQ